MVGCFFFLSLSLVTWAVCMVCQETTVPRSLPEPPMWPLSSDSSWSLWINTGLALAPSSLIRSFLVSVFSVWGQGFQPCFYSTRIVFLITYQNFSITQQLKSLHFSCKLLPFCFIYQCFFCTDYFVPPIIFGGSLLVTCRVMRRVKYSVVMFIVTKGLYNPWESASNKYSRNWAWSSEFWDACWNVIFWKTQMTKWPGLFLGFFFKELGENQFCKCCPHMFIYCLMGEEFKELLVVENV